MTRPTGHAASRPFRLTRSAVEAHPTHYPTPFLGCAICARRTAMTPLQIRWMLAPPGPDPPDDTPTIGQLASGERVDPGRVGGLPRLSSASFDSR